MPWKAKYSISAWRPLQRHRWIFLQPSGIKLYIYRRDFPLCRNLWEAEWFFPHFGVTLLIESASWLDLSMTRRNSREKVHSSERLFELHPPAHQWPANEIEWEKFGDCVKVHLAVLFCMRRVKSSLEKILIVLEITSSARASWQSKKVVT